MALTEGQVSLVKAEILSDPALDACPHTADGALAIAEMLSLQATPAFWVWSTSVGVQEIMQNGFDWTRVDNLSVGKARIWEFMTAAGRLNPSQPNVRDGFLACFNQAADVATRQAIFGHCARLARRVERLFAVGDGQPPTADGIGPAVMGFEGTLTYQDILLARSTL